MMCGYLRDRTLDSGNTTGICELTGFGPHGLVSAALLPNHSECCKPMSRPRPSALPKRLSRAVAGLGLVLAGCLAASVVAYESAIHQKLTFLAAKQLNRCLVDSGVPAMNALQVRMVAKANARQAEANLFVRIVRWSYYDRSGVEDRELLWVVDTRMHEHFNQQVSRLADAAADAYRHVGRILNHVQDVTSPAHAVPVYTGRWWRLSWRDRFDSFSIDQAQVAAAVEKSCTYLLANPASYHRVLQDAAEDTLTAVSAPVFGLPTTWEAFWTLNDDPGKFGEYGPAGNNFGRDASFPCGGGERCVLLREDPLFRDFALQRHITAVVASMRVLLTLQRQR